MNWNGCKIKLVNIQIGLDCSVSAKNGPMSNSTMRRLQWAAWRSRNLDGSDKRQWTAVYIYVCI